MTNFTHKSPANCKKKKKKKLSSPYGVTSGLMLHFHFRAVTGVESCCKSHVCCVAIGQHPAENSPSF